MKVLIVSADRTTSAGVAQNLGDAFLTDALANFVRDRGHEVRIADAGQPGRDVHRVPVRSISELGAAIRWADRVLLGGGTLLQDDQPERWYGGLPRLVVATSTLATATRTPLSLVGVGADVVRRHRMRLSLTAATARRPITFRDALSQSRFGGRGTVSGDVCLLHGITRSSAHRSGALVMAAGPEAAALTVNQVGALRKRHGFVRFVSMDQGEHADALRLPRALRRGFDDLLIGTSWPTALESVGRSEAVYSSRMHALYMALLTGTPAAGFSLRPKVHQFCRSYAVPHTSSGFTVEPAHPGFDQVDEDVRRARRMIGASLEHG